MKYELSRERGEGEGEGGGGQGKARLGEKKKETSGHLRYLSFLHLQACFHMTSCDTMALPKVNQVNVH